MDTPPLPEALVAFFADSQVPLSLTDAADPEDPLLLVNDAFLRMSGYTRAEVIGRNCRFLQGEATLPRVRQQIRGDLTADRDSKVLITNYRKSGEPFDNFLFLFSLPDVSGKPLYRIGSQFEVPALGRGRAFQDHTDALRSGLDRLNADLDGTHQQLVRTAELVGVSIKALLTARLDLLTSA